jgi:hypothetical protein
MSQEGVGTMFWKCKYKEPACSAAKVEEMKTPLPGPKPAQIDYSVPDLSTKPADLVAHSFAWTCTGMHSFEFFTELKVEALLTRKICAECGCLAQVSIVRRIAEAQWSIRALGYVDYRLTVSQHPHDWTFNLWLAGPLNWTRAEFVRFLKEPDVNTA